MSNLPVLQQNTLAGFSEGAAQLYLDMLDEHQGWSNRANENRAFYEAYKYEREVGEVTNYIIDKMSSFPEYSSLTDHPDTVKTDLKMFIKDRYRHNFMEK